MTCTPEAELLILATRLDLEPEQERRAEALLEALDWDVLLGQGAPFGMLPLLHHHLSRPALAGKVPPAASAALAQAYFRTSMKNLRMLGLLRRVLAQAQEQGLAVLLLKGAFLARRVYGDVGLRPMADLDLLCRKEDEPALRGILEGLGGFQALSLDGPGFDLGRVRPVVMEKIGHAAAWWFRDTCRIEIHYHLLSKPDVDNGWFEAQLWAQAAGHDWDGLAVRALSPPHLVLHLAAHLARHLEEGAFNLYWLADLREVLRQQGGSLDRAALGTLARRLGLERDCAAVFALLGEAWEQAAPDEETALRSLADRMAAALKAPPGGHGVLSFSAYLDVFRAVRHVPGFWNKVVYFKEVLLPPPSKLAWRYPGAPAWVFPLLYLADPFVRVYQTLRSRSNHGR